MACCSDCGECCKGNPVAGMLEPRQLRDYKRDGENGGFCYYYDRGRTRCRIYRHRPWYCEQFPALAGVRAEEFPDCTLTRS